MKLNFCTKLHRSISYSFLLILYGTCRASVTAQRPSLGAFSHKNPPSARSSWPVFHMQSHLPYFLEEPRSANLQLLRRPRTLSKYFSVREGTLVWKCWPVFHMQSHLLYFLEEPRSANLQLLRRPRTLSKYFSVREGALVWPSLFEYCVYILAKTADCSHKLSLSLFSTNDNCLLSVWRCRRL
jgi:hypothetical protein